MWDCVTGVGCGRWRKGQKDRIPQGAGKERRKRHNQGLAKNTLSRISPCSFLLCPAVWGAQGREVAAKRGPIRATTKASRRLVAQRVPRPGAAAGWWLPRPSWSLRNEGVHYTSCRVGAPGVSTLRCGEQRARDARRIPRDIGPSCPKTGHDGGR